ncbi:putative quinol monooxygenase [Aliirhizobium smilacinae]|uniref:Antibiotic biosynthesis monooxygenase n=1 Tax=Aliirhizobium smilacinae TaxID=1395944 RepID=A0A5C4XSL7_9HYPH|nr:putative quinol monooxygenase [Rhizobium smilacinae]TNM65664.1 antibiotic biosynthesis monooxygenase [Rhizobium smilacinae]
MTTETNAAKIVAILTALPGKANELQALLSGMAASCRAEPGNLRWDIWQDHSNPERFVLDELYIDAAAVDAHRQTPHFKDYASKINTLAERTAYVVTPVNLG